MKNAESSKAHQHVEAWQRNRSQSRSRGGRASEKGEKTREENVSARRVSNAAEGSRLGRWENDHWITVCVGETGVSGDFAKSF